MLAEKRWGELPEQDDRRQFDFAVWNLNRSAPAWSMIIGKMNIRIDHRVTLISIGMLPGGVITMGVNFEVFRKLGTKARMQAIAMSGQKLLNGQLSTMGKNIERKYGELAAEMGLLMCLAPKVPHTELAAAGFHIPTPKEYGLPEGRAWEFYAAAIRKLMDQESDKPPPAPGKGQPTQGGGVGTDPGDDDADIFGKPQPKSGPLNTQPANWHPEDLDDVREQADQGRKIIPTQAAWYDNDGNSIDPNQADLATKAMIDEVDKQYKIRDRGFVAGEGLEWMDLLFAPPQVSWRDKLRFKMAGKGRHWRVPTRRRPSRRPAPNADPEVPSPFEGRKWRGQCNVLVLCDVSGSRRHKQIVSVNPEMRAMVYSGADVWFCQVDAAVQNVEKYTGDEDGWDIFGRGGTTLQPAFTQMELVKKKAGVQQFDFVVVCTDGYTDDLDFGDNDVLVLLDSDGEDITKYAEKLTGDSFDIAVLDVDPEDDPDKLIGI
jgi:hypothetical protein